MKYEDVGSAQQYKKAPQYQKCHSFVGNKNVVDSVEKCLVLKKRKIDKKKSLYRHMK